MKAQNQVISWLLEEGQPAVRYYTLSELLDFPADNPEVEQAYSEIPTRGWAFDILRMQKPDGRWESKKSLYRPKYTATNWMALVLSDLGLTRDNASVAKAAQLFFKEWISEDAPDSILHDEVCIVGNTARMLTRFGYGDDARVRRLYDRLLEDQKDDGGWHCFESTKGTLDCWEALAAFAAIPKSQRTRRIRNSIERGAEFYLKQNLFNDGDRKYLPWFRFHYPVHYYYDVLVGLDVITELGYGDDKRLVPALKILNRKRRKGTWVLDRVHPDPPSYAWGKGNARRTVKPFGLEKTGSPSKWITLTALRVLKRVREQSSAEPRMAKGTTR